MNAPPPPSFATPLVQTCAQPNQEVHVVVAATPPPTEYLGEVTQPTTVLVEVAVDSDGTVIGARVHKSSGNDKLDRAAIVAARKTTFSPRIVDCNPSRAIYLFHVLFTPPSPGPSPTPTSKIPSYR